jgi:hypothetical protein
MGIVLVAWGAMALFGVPIAFVFGWVYFKNRLGDLEVQIALLRERLNENQRAGSRIAVSPQPEPPQEAPVAIDLPQTPRVDTPAPFMPVEPPIVPMRPQPLPAFLREAPHRSSQEWETILGGNWLNKVGVFVLVVGIALALGYSFTRLTAVGRVSIGIAASLAMLAAGAILEPRERYRTFARGLLGGGWAALYITVFAMHTVEAAKVVQNPVLGFVLLLAVAAGMILHSLRYRSETVTGLAYLTAFGTLIITEVRGLPLLALIPLAVSLLYLAHRFTWPRMAILGVIATYGIGALRGDSGAAMWAAQAVLAVYWLLFETFDILHPSSWLLPLNAAGFIGLSLLKWSGTAPQQIWILLSAIAIAHLLSGVARWPSGAWRGAATLSAALLAAAIVQKLEHQWVATALVLEAELIYLAGIRLRVPYLRWLGTSVFGVSLGRLLLLDIEALPGSAWVPVASIQGVVFYVNRALCAADSFYGYAGAGLLALALGQQTSEPYRGIAWLLLAAVTFVLGWRRSLFDFRLQGYLLGILGLTAILARTDQAPLGLAAALCYGVALCALSTPLRFLEGEAPIVRLSAATATAVTTAALLWRVTPGGYVGLSWLGLALVLLEVGLRSWPSDFRRLSYAMAVLGILRLWIANLPELHNDGPYLPRLVPLAAAVLVYVSAIRARRQEAGRVFTLGVPAGTVLLLAAVWAVVPAGAVAPVCAAVSLVLTVQPWGSHPERSLCRIVGCAVAALAFVRCWWFNFGQAGLVESSAMACLVIACFYAVQLQSPRGQWLRLYYALLGVILTTVLLDYKISGSLLTVAWGIEGLLSLGCGFPLRDRILRLSGLALLLGCILKLFVWDLRHLETLPRILSFIVLGLILVGVSWVYTRFREQVAKYL